MTLERQQGRVLAKPYPIAKTLAAKAFAHPGSLPRECHRTQRDEHTLSFSGASSKPEET